MRRYVPTNAVKETVKGREAAILEALGIDWQSGNQHISCPYPDHEDETPSWRWDENKARAYCTCIDGSHSILDVAAARQGVDVEAAKLWIAETLGRGYLVRVQPGGSGDGSWHGAAEDLLNPGDDVRDEGLPRAYLAHRLGVSDAEVPIPSTPSAGWKRRRYYDPPPGGPKSKPKCVGEFPCAVFGTRAVDGRTHAQLVYVAPGGAGKANLGSSPNGPPRAQKKSARIEDGGNRAGCAVFWGNPEQAPHLLLTEGIETGAAVACAFRETIDRSEIAVAAAISTAGMVAFQPFPVTRRVTVCADRDEGPGKPRVGPGERAARQFALQCDENVEVSIALPGSAGEELDWLDVFVTEGADTVPAPILFAPTFEPTEEELASRTQTRAAKAALADVAKTYPLPPLNSHRLRYDFAANDRVMVHKIVRGPSDKSTGLVQEQRIPIMTPFGVVARSREVDRQDAYGLRCVVQDMNSRPRSVDIDRAELAKMNGAEIKAKLYEAGLRTELDGDDIVLRCLKAASPDDEISVYRQPGWHRMAADYDPFFICPNGEVIGAPEEFRPELHTSVALHPADAVCGTLEGWKEAIGAAVSVTRCPHWLLGTIGGFVGPLISLTGLDSCGVNLSGQSSSGKSTAQRLAVSSWSTPDVTRRGLAQSARATANGMEAVAQRGSGTVLSLDELALISGKELAAAIYMIAGGTGKTRLRSDATLRQRYSWHTFAILSCECSLQEKIETDGSEWRAGTAVLFPDIDVAEVDRAVSPQILRLIEQVNDNYGRAGPAFIRAIVDGGLHRNGEEIHNRVLKGAERLAGANADSARRRAAIPFALLKLAGSMAKTFGLLPEDAPVDEAVKWAWARFEKSSDAFALDPEEHALAKLRRYTAERWDVTIRSVEDHGSAGREQVGWYDHDTVYIPKDRMFEACGKVLKASNIGPMLSRCRLLSRQTERDRYCTRWVPSIGKVACYPLRRDEFGRTGQASAESKDRVAA